MIILTNFGLAATSLVSLDQTDVFIFISSIQTTKPPGSQALFYTLIEVV